MAIDKKTVEHVAHLARIELQPKELEKLSGQLMEILAFIDQLQKVDIKDIKPTSHILPLSNVLREDKLRQSLSSEEALKNAPRKHRNFFVVPKVIE
ncbi:MAG: Asp-tRNA(Asn)/Glu-tRNA(Gln) amidotransferase subunit GatC [Candidatus Omnitrophica bacterium]|nr:Asp-tRNA(Asn)/Glu-tRNA(Gln) amidotransferase subunit GatC [Candidatus Omnitrophota bacterium]MBU1905368.1 Asp-tRNA(Asn)/Glu-tRNA(Gln) amidotransferase subunit GatC [Candidatus Omnitrophota bacterium]